MKYLFVGLGSIGQRHLQNLKDLDKDAEIFALRKGGKNLVIKDGKAKEVKDLSEYYGFKTISSMDEAKKIEPDVSFITNPSSMHAETALELAKIGSHLFIEKPLSNSLENVNELSKTIEKNNLVSFLGYQTRFHPFIEKAKKLIESNKKNLICSGFEWSTYLPAHHKYEDYSKGYAARKDLGGGVLLNLIHEIDLIQYFFGKPDRIIAVGGKLSNLKMTAEDTVMAILIYNINNRQFPVYLKLSFAQIKEQREFSIQFNDSLVCVDLDKNTFELYDKKSNLIEKINEKIERNSLFKKELTYFLNCVKAGKKASPDVPEGIKSLEIALDMKKQIKSGDINE